MKLRNKESTAKENFEDYTPIVELIGACRGVRHYRRLQRGLAAKIAWKSYEHEETSVKQPADVTITAVVVWLLLFILQMLFILDK